MSKVQTVELENGKYELRLHEESGALCAYRNGEPWQDFSGNKFVYLLMQEVLNLREAVRGLREAQAEPVLTVGGKPGDAKFGKVFVGPPAFTETVCLPAGTKLYATPASAPPAGDPPTPAAAREVVEARLSQSEIIGMWGARSDGPTNTEIISFARLIERAALAAAKTL